MISTVLTNDTIEKPEETLCTICATSIVNYVQKYFHGEAFNPACDKCDDNSWVLDENISKAETDVEDAKILVLPSAHLDNCILNDIEDMLEEFLRNFRCEESSIKYYRLSLELVRSNEIKLDVSMADNRILNKMLMDLINYLDYKEFSNFATHTSNLSKLGIQRCIPRDY